MEWFIFILYGLTAIATAQRWWRSSVEREDVIDQRFWLALAGGLAWFGLNKVADLQTPFLQTLKHIALQLNLEAFRSGLKSVLLATVLLAAVVIGATLLRYFRNPLRRHWGVTVGGLGLVSYYLLRAAAFLGPAPTSLHDPRVAFLEATGLLAILASALRR